MLCLIYVLIQVWKNAAIATLSKASTKEKHSPLNYPGISILSVVSKLYSAVLNNRFFNYLEE